MLANMTRLNAKGVDTRNGAAVLEYMKQTATEYYIGADGKEKSSSRWIGRGSESLGLSGRVDVKHMELLAKGIAPDGTKLRQNSGDATRMGWDHTFSSNKYFSLLVAGGPQASKESNMEAHHAGVEAGMNYYASVMQVRTGKGGMGEKLSIQGVVASAHTHYCSRSHDMQIHTHVLQYNCAMGSDGIWRALDTEVAKDHIKTAGALARVQEAWELKKKGYGIIKDRQLDADGRETGEIFYKIAGISDELCDRYSKRRNEILEHQMANGGSEQEACLATRKDKDEPSYEELTKIWDQSLAQLRKEEPGLVFQSVESLKGLPDELGQFTDHDILKHLHKHESSFTMAHVIERVAVENIGRMDAQGVMQEAQAFMLRNQIVELDPPKRGRLDAGEQRFAAQWMIDMEQRIKTRAESRIDDQTVRLDPKVVEQSIAKIDAKNGFAMSDEQRKAVNWATVNTGGVTVIQGRAGAGKTTSIEAAVDAYHASGFNVIGVSTAWEAALKLEAAAGCESYSVEKLLNDLDKGSRKLTNRDVILFDEAGMAGTEAIDRIGAHVEHAGGKLILMGDSKQIPPVVAGNPFVSMIASVGAADIKTVMRQKSLEDLRLVNMVYDDISPGAKVMQDLTERDRAFGHESRKEAIRDIAERYANNTRPAQDKLVIASTNSEVRLLNHAIRDKRKEAGQISGEEASFQGKANGKWHDLALATGDRVRFSERNKDLGTFNGLQGVVEGVEMGREKGSFRIAVRSQSDVASRDGKLIQFDTADFRSLNYAYAGTNHKGQGQSISDVYLLLNPDVADRNSALVSVSRMKENLWVFGSHEDIARMPGAINRQRPKLNALDQLPKPKVEIVVPTTDPAKDLGRQMGAVVREHQQQLKGRAIRR